MVRPRPRPRLRLPPRLDGLPEGPADCGPEWSAEDVSMTVTSDALGGLGSWGGGGGPGS